MLMPLPFFFFQAEDGIRDHCVTGVQTCALPISAANFPDVEVVGMVDSVAAVSEKFAAAHGGRPYTDLADMVRTRSEERRVGKECRSERSTHHKQHRMVEDRGSEVAKAKAYGTPR